MVTNCDQSERAIVKQSHQVKRPVIDCDHLLYCIMALKGVTVIEFSRALSVPYCGMILADFGARVIKIDKPQPSPVDYLSRGKQSIVLNLKSKESVNVVKRLCSKADVLIEAFKPGFMENLGLGPDVLTSQNRKLVYARLTAYGQGGHLSQKQGTDINCLAISGLLSKIGRNNEPPYAPLNIAGEFIGSGAMGALGIVLALNERNMSGQGQIIDANMVDGAAYLGSWLGANKSFFTKQRGNNLLDGGAAFYNTYKTKDDKYVAVGALEDRNYQELLKGLGLTSSDVNMTDSQEKQMETFANIFVTKKRDEWTQVFKDLDACVTPVMTGREASLNPHNASRETFLKKPETPQLMANPAPHLKRSYKKKDYMPLPSVGQHTAEVLKEYGYSQLKIDELIAQGVLIKGT
ncbi:hypothetical protein Btru_016520 [Bulinus truncatus]|nr:hypothetical protein Btru_016520 [Bulinus truncatus]